LGLTISHSVRIKDGKALRDGSTLPLLDNVQGLAPEAYYRALQYSYPKFFKMDVLCKWGWLGAEALLTENGQLVYEGMDKHKVAVVLATSSGCLDIDKKYQQSIINIPSPALFVYTLSNIVLGEICIRHGFKGEQACFVSDGFDSSELHFWVNDLLVNRGMDACLCGWVDAVDYQHDVSMFWVVKNGNGVPFSPAAMQQLYHT
jgi:hypothetical protein